MLEVIEAPASDLVDLAMVKSHLGIVGTDDDAIIGALIARASAAITSYIGAPILAGTYRETLETGGGQAVIALSRYPVTTVTSVEVDGSELPSGFRLDADAGLLLRTDSAGRSRPWECGAVVEVSYSAGYATCPPDIEQAVLELVSAAWSQRGRDPGLKSIGIGSINLGYFGADALPGIASVAPLLDRYRVPAVG
ncbi:putative phiE125 gp8 family phage protein [Azospirillum lipoferum]|uniref:Phage gp6-like head-tail connector protein n=1 Tax=Azospirillum lipoferum TaxID=193 RepID=A0A5A9GRU9_AZOLI|nr:MULTISPECIES: phage head-tail connector protein [Azospirillum]KAA0597211.1 hypothetical protein FZ942_08960 [Azospirillum lipoferum]MCP1608722.1 putative phiE125 gp8 family phage protein [Azospirillum lipoferum]MDW5535960.1 phage head-tail connector protein [Azospirillum sp. NL1]